MKQLRAQHARSMGNGSLIAARNVGVSMATPIPVNQELCHTAPKPLEPEA